MEGKFLILLYKNFTALYNTVYTGFILQYFTLCGHIFFAPVNNIANRSFLSKKSSKYQYREGTNSEQRLT